MPTIRMATDLSWFRKWQIRKNIYFCFTRQRLFQVAIYWLSKKRNRMRFFEIIKFGKVQDFDHNRFESVGPWYFMVALPFQLRYECEKLRCWKLRWLPVRPPRPIN